MKEHMRDFCGATATITEHRDGTATLTVYAGGKRYRTKHKNHASAKRAWYRRCS